MAEWLLALGDLFIITALFYWFMTKCSDRRFSARWPYILGYSFFALGAWGTMYMMNDVLRSVILLGMAVVLQCILFEKKVRALFYCICYTLGIMLCQLLAVFIGQWILLNVATVSFISIGISNPLKTLGFASFLLKLFLEISWTWFIIHMWQKGKTGMMSRKQALFFLMFPLCTSFFMISLLVSSDVFVLRYGYGLLIVNFVLCFCMNIFALYFFRFVQKGNQAEKEATLYAQEKDLLYRHYTQIEENYRVSRKVIHDVKNHMQAVLRLYEDGESEKARDYAWEVFHLLNQTGHQWYTENKMMNIILNEKLNYETLKDAELELELDDLALSRFRDIDVTTIFANLLDNAAEAVGTGAHKFLKLQVKQVRSFTIIKMVNSKGTVTEEKQVHQGLGLKNVESALMPYQGTMKIVEEEDSFCVTIMIPGSP